MKFLTIFTLFISIALCEIKIPEKYLKARNIGELVAKKKGRTIGVEKHVIGQNVELGDIPYYALSYVENGEPNTAWLCGGSLIHHEWILSSAHCFEFTHLTTFLGIIRQEIHENPVTGTGKYAEWESGSIARSNIFLHPSYNPSTFTNDIALMKIPLTLETFNSFTHVGVIKLPTRSEVDNRFVGQKAETSGFGADIMSEVGISEYLLSSKVEIIENSACQTVISEPAKDNEICTKEGYACIGDGGGPLTLSINGADRVIGVTSIENLCLDGLFSGIYVRVPSYLDWIATTAGSDLIEQGTTTTSEGPTTTSEGTTPGPASTTPNSAGLVKLSVFLSILGFLIAFL